MALGPPQLGQAPAVQLLHLDACLAQTACVEEGQQKMSATAACLHPAQNRQHSFNLASGQ